MQYGSRFEACVFWQVDDELLPSYNSLVMTMVTMMLLMISKRSVDVTEKAGYSGTTNEGVYVKIE